ncbi:MAG: hypothetical protein HUU02_15315 [Bacteroidetes bacterium]|nr:hypothetical protein [Bacteroidota bacterium]
MRTIILTLFITAVSLQAQITTKSADIFEEMESGALTLRIHNAVNGRPVPGAVVVIGSVGEYVTDEEGKLLFPAPPEDGVLTATIAADGYITSAVPIEIMAGTLFFNRISISPVMDIKRVRIVVDWDKKPLDLDAHLVKQGADGYHISYRNMRTLADKSGMLDIDAMRGYGPETITVNEISASSTYEYFIHDYSNAKNSSSAALSESKAMVKVYGEGKLLKVFTVPRKKEGTVWNVFTIERGHIREAGQLRAN